MAKIPDRVKDLLERPIVAALTTIAPDGIPENTAIWLSWDGEYMTVNTADNRRKAKNIRQNPNVALYLIDPDNSQRWLDIRGQVESVLADDNYENLNKQAKKYVGVDTFYGGVAPAENEGTEDRIVIKIKPVRVASQG